MSVTLIITFLFGLVFGSFLNVCIYRLPRGESISFPPSHCISCENRLRPKDLIPVVSFFLLKGECRYCGEKIHWRYPVIELVNALGWVGIIFLYGITIKGLAGILLFSLFLIVTAIDLEHLIILDSITLLFFLSGIIYHFISRELTLTGRLLGAAVGFFLLLFLAYISKGGMGGGDIKLCGAMGFWLGFPVIFLALFVGSLVGSIVGIFLLVTKIKKRKEPIPFGPFLMFGFLTVFFFQQQLLSWYWSLF
jgi:leader peptidase (prepilin peptidase)/N-methyltransferase